MEKVDSYKDLGVTFDKKIPSQQGWVSSGKNLFLPNLRFKPN